MKKILCPSMMCADYSQLQKEVTDLDKAGIDIFHCDVMDGTFVANMTMGIMDIKAIRKYTNKPIDVHLMIENPREKVKWFIDAGVDIIYIHPESERYVVKTLLTIKESGIKVGIAINPDTSIETIHEYIELCDYIMVMTVNPGFAGQSFLSFTQKKIEKLITLKKEHNFTLVIDGSCSQDIIKKYSDLGVDGFILGTSALFDKEKPYQEIVKELREL